MKMINCKIFFCLFYLDKHLNLLKTLMFGLEFTLSLMKSSSNKIEILLILYFRLREKLGKVVTK